MFPIFQVVAGSINDIAHLWIASALLALAYRSAFSQFPPTLAVCLEWFGMRKCWASPFPFFIECYLISTLLWKRIIFLCHISGLVTSFLLYSGGTLTRTAVLQHTMLSPHIRVHVYSAPQCLLGLHCYPDTIYLTTFATFLAIFLSICTGYRYRLKIAMSHKTKLASSRSEVVWHDEWWLGRF